MKRPDWSWVWGRLAVDMAKRSRCSRSKIGAVIVSAEQRVVATGYNGPPANWQPFGSSVDRECGYWCDRGCHGPTDETATTYADCPSNHAEINALMHSDRRDREGGSIFVTGTMCYACAKAVANSGITKVYLVNANAAEESHRNPERSRQLLTDSDLQVYWITVVDPVETG